MSDDPITRLNAALEGRYRLERELGQGGMAVVYLAEDLRHRRRVAIKVMRPEISRSLGSGRFLREIEIAARLAHPNILPLHDSGEADGLLWFVMPWVDGETLRARLDRSAVLSVDEAIRITGEVADALDYAHEQGLVHRDVKPENILFQAGHAVVSDFGIAKATRDAGPETLTGTGVALGTLRYMSPEQAVGDKEVNARSPSSIWSARSRSTIRTSPTSASTRSSTTSGTSPAFGR